MIDSTAKVHALVFENLPWSSGQLDILCDLISNAGSFGKFSYAPEHHLLNNFILRHRITLSQKKINFEFQYSM